MKKLTLATLFAASLFGNAQAQTAHSSATLSNYTFQLIDLDPTDNIAPSITFSGQSVTSVAVFDGDVPAFSKSVFLSSAGVDTRTTSAAFTTTSGQASVTAGSGVHQLIGASATASGQALMPSLGSDGTNFTSYDVTANLLGTVTFTLSAHTGLVMTANADIYTSTAGTFDWIGNYATATAGAFIRIGLTESSVNMYTYDSTDHHLSQLLSVSYMNNSANTVSTYLGAGAYASGGNIVTSVPEPETYAMLLAGLGLVGFVARRRRNNNA